MLGDDSKTKWSLNRRKFVVISVYFFHLLVGSTYVCSLGSFQLNKGKIFSQFFYRQHLLPVNLWVRICMTQFFSFSKHT